MIRPVSLQKQFVAAVMFCLALSISTAGRDRDAKPKPEILWVQEVNGQALYWVNDKPVGRAPLSGMNTIFDSIQKNGLIVIMDSRVPISEMGGIDGILAKVPYDNARYFVFDRELPGKMSEIRWSSEMVALPQKPPPVHEPNGSSR